MLTALVATLGAAALAANHIAFTALEAWFLTSLALSVTATALAGQSFGAGRPDEAMVAARIIRRWALVWNLVGMLVMVVGARPILSVFSNDPNVIDSGVVVMVVVGLTLPLWGLSLVTTGPCAAAATPGRRCTAARRDLGLGAARLDRRCSSSTPAWAGSGEPTSSPCRP